MGIVGIVLLIALFTGNLNDEKSSSSDYNNLDQEGTTHYHD